MSSSAETKQFSKLKRTQETKLVQQYALIPIRGSNGGILNCPFLL